MNLTGAHISLSGRKAVSTMSTSRLLILGAWIIHVASWFLTAVEVQETHTPVAGWKAFRLAACAIWPCEEVQFQTVHHEVLATLSVITTLFFVLCSPWVVLRGSRLLRRWSAWAAAAAFIFNTHWIITFGPQRSELAIGYYLWLLSFLLLAIGLFVSSRLVVSVNDQLDETRISKASGQT
jgi:hypothetical protein